MPTEPRIDAALRQLQATIARTTDPATLAPFASDESGRHGEVPLAVLKPASAADVQEAVRWATRHQIPLLPISSAAGPRRRGDTLSDRAHVVLDLSAMDRLVHVDGRDAVAIIEPGITFARLNALLQPHGLRSYQPLAPRRSKSVLAAFLEREPMTVPGRHWDPADPLAAMELVFGTGEAFRTGGAGMPGTLEDNLARGNRQLIAPGPSFTDFGRVVQGSQGALGVVVWASLLCQRIPARELPLFATSDDLDAVVELCYRMLRRRPAGQMFIVNRVQLAMLLADDSADFEAIKTALPHWTLYVELSAPAYFPDEAIAYQRADLERDAAALGVTVGTSVAGRAAASVAERQRAFPELAAHRRIGRVCQEVFGLSQLDAAPAQHAAVSALAAAHTDLAVYLQPTTQGVNVHAQFTLLDRPGQETALAISAVKVAETLADKRVFFSRPYHPWAHVPFARDRSIQPLIDRTKALFDPAGILKPDAMSLGSFPARKVSASKTSNGAVQ